MKLNCLLILMPLLQGVANAFVPSALTPSVRGTTISKLHSVAVADDTASKTAFDVDASFVNLDVPDEGKHNDHRVTDPRPPPIPRPSPGLAENASFACDSSVEFWREFRVDGSARDNLREIAAVTARFAAPGRRPGALGHWVRHVGRTGYFAGNAALGTLGSVLHGRFTGGGGGGAGGMPFGLDSRVATRLVLEAFLSYEQDYVMIEEDQYREPWDMKSNHRQSSPVNVLTQTSRFVDEAIGTLARRRRQRDEDKRIRIPDDDGVSSSLYPDYYRTAFHYQSDGWMSKRSADVYETSTETLFLGRQDAMQRTALPPIVRHAKNHRSAEEGSFKVLEVACGTGRFMTFLRDSLPLDAECTAVDLSPYYLDAARDNDAYWRKTRAAEEDRAGYSNMGRGGIKPLRLVQARAEDLPFDDESFDAVVCVYLYHELPREVRAAASAEMARVLRTGGVLVLADSIQTGDRPALDSKISNFEKMNEPYYADYCQDDLGAHFVGKGLSLAGKVVRSTTKSLSFTK